MAAIDDLIKQIQSRSNTSQWSGGYGADAATKDMARILSSIGITNIKDFGKIDKYEPVQQIGMTLNGQPVQGSGSQLYVLEAVDTGDGTDYVRRDLSPEQAAQVKPTYGVVTGTDEYNQPTYRTVEATNVGVKDGQLVGVTGQTFGNKLTGQEVPNTYTTRQTGDFFGGTYEGKGNTGYGVQFDAQGLPVFYTQGASSKDEALVDLMPMVQLALMATGAGGLLGNALLGTGASQVAAGALGGALLGGGTAAIAGQDVLKGALLGGAGGALSGYLNPATGQVSATPTEGSIPVSANDIASLGGTDLGIDYSLSNSTAMRPLTDMGGAQGLRAGTAANLAEMGGAQGLTFNVGAPVTNIADAVRAISTMNGSVNPANLDSMGGGQGLTYQTPTGLVTQDAILNVGGLTGNNSVISGGGIDSATNIGSDIAKRVAAIDTGVDRMKLPATPVDAKTAAKTGLTASDAIRAASVAATIAGINAASKPTGSGGFPIVPIPSDWTSPIKPTGTAAFTPLAPIDFGNKEMLRGTQWEQLLSPDYGKAPAMPTSTNPSNMTFNELTKILGGSTTSAPSQNLSINDVIAGIQSQYGQAPQGSMG
jgi:hypothetical protein